MTTSLRTVATRPAVALMGVGQLLFAVAPSYPSALLARALLGCGDAMTFVSVLLRGRTRFSPRRYPVLVALTGTVGTVGNVLATLPLEQALQHFGWTASFTLAASLSLVAAVAVWTLLDDRAAAPPRLRTVGDVRSGIGSVSRRVVAAWALPGTRLGFWVHFACMTSACTFGVLWGHPYLVDGAGFDSAVASTVLMVGVFVSGIAGPLVGWVIGRWPTLRVGLTLALCGTTVLGWTLVVAVFGARPPQAYIAALLVFTFLGGPVSMVAFALARDYNSPRILGTASGVVNVGGFLATAAVSVVFGEVLTLLGGTGAAQLRWALVVPIVVQLFGTAKVFVWVRRLRTVLVGQQQRGDDVPVPVGRRHSGTSGGTHLSPV